MIPKSAGLPARASGFSCCQQLPPPAPTRGKCGLRSLFPRERAGPALPPGALWWQVPLCTRFFPSFGKAIPPGRGKTRIRWVSKKEQARLAVLALREIHPGAGGAAGAPAPAPRTVDVFGKEATPGAGDRNSGLPTPRGVSRSQGSGVMLTLALWSFRLGFDGFFFFSLMKSFSQKKRGVSPSPALLSGRAGRIWRISASNIRGSWAGVSQIPEMLADISVVIWEGIAGVLPPTPAYCGNLPDVERGMETSSGPGLGGVTSQGHKTPTETPLTTS